MYKQKFHEIDNRFQWHKQTTEKKLDERKEDLLTKQMEKKAITLQPEKKMPLEILESSAPGGLKAVLLDVTKKCKRHTEQELKITMASK